MTLLSNYGDCSVTTKQIRCKKNPTGYRDISKPNCVIEYNKHMGGTDLAGQQCVYYAHAHRSVKWWKRVFLAILDICVLNARILYNSIHTNRTLLNLDFRMYLIQGLLLTWKNGPVTHVQMSNPCVSEGAQHFPGKNVTGTALFVAQKLREGKPARFANSVISPCVSLGVLRNFTPLEFIEFAWSHVS